MPWVFSKLPAEYEVSFWMEERKSMLVSQDEGSYTVMILQLFPTMGPMSTWFYSRLGGAIVWGSELG